jgi:hypothetical protein
VVDLGQREQVPEEDGVEHVRLVVEVAVGAVVTDRSGRRSLSLLKIDAVVGDLVKQQPGADHRPLVVA